MSAIRRCLLRDTVTVASKSGEGGLGPILAETVDVACKASWTRQLVRAADGAEVLSQLTLYVHPADAAPFVPDALVTFGDYASSVIAVSPQNRPGEAVLVKVVCS